MKRPYQTPAVLGGLLFDAAGEPGWTGPVDQRLPAALALGLLLIGLQAAIGDGLEAPPGAQA